MITYHIEYWKSKLCSNFQLLSHWTLDHCRWLFQQQCRHIVRFFTMKDWYWIVWYCWFLRFLSLQLHSKEHQWQATYKRRIEIKIFGLLAQLTMKNFDFNEFENESQVRVISRHCFDNRLITPEWSAAWPTPSRHWNTKLYTIKLMFLN